MRKLILLVGILAVSACAQATDAVNSDVTQAKLQTDTAKYFDTSPRYVKVGNLKQSMVGTAYQARVGGRLYDCKYFRSAVSCWRAS
ncbi:MAG: hypothetical protein HKN18_03685 [Silicimonas sp.]|nr:hypothetical protein [Silicimonas sp.]